MRRLKREEERIAREMAEKEEEEARAVLEQAARSGKIKLPTAEGKLDKEAILSQVFPGHALACALNPQQLPNSFCAKPLFANSISIVATQKIRHKAAHRTCSHQAV